MQQVQAVRRKVSRVDLVVRVVQVGGRSVTVQQSILEYEHAVLVGGVRPDG